MMSLVLNVNGSGCEFEIQTNWTWAYIRLFQTNEGLKHLVRTRNVPETNSCTMFSMRIDQSHFTENVACST